MTNGLFSNGGVLHIYKADDEKFNWYLSYDRLNVLSSEQSGIITLSPKHDKYFLKTGVSTIIKNEPITRFPAGYVATIVFFSTYDPNVADFAITANQLKSVSDDGVPIEDLKVSLGVNGLLITVYKSDENAIQFNWFFSRRVS